MNIRGTFIWPVNTQLPVASAAADAVSGAVPAVGPDFVMGGGGLYSSADELMKPRLPIPPAMRTT